MAEDLTSILNTLRSTIGTQQSTYTAPAYTTVGTPELRSADTINKLLGVNFTYDRNAIENIYNNATKSAYNAASVEQRNAESAYNRSMATAQDTGLDTIRQLNNSAIASGASKGMQAANTLSAILGNSQAAAEQATLLAQNRQKVGADYAAQLRTDAANALKYSNDMAAQVGQLAHQYYNDDIQKLTAQLSYNQGINTDAAGYAANQYTADSNLSSNLANAATGVYNNNTSAAASIQAALEQAAAQRYAAEQSANAQRYAADQSKVQTYNYNYNNK